MNPPQDSHRVTDQPASEQGGGDAKRTILLYSPDLNFCFSLSMLFQDRYNVITTTNVGTLDKLVTDYSADLVLVDAVPSAKLLERLDDLKGLNRRLPIIALYVYNTKYTDLDQSIRGRIDAVFYKPFEVVPLSRKIEELLGGTP